MKLKIGTTVLVVVSLIVFAAFYRVNDAEVVGIMQSVQPVLAGRPETVNVAASYSSTLSSGSLENTVSSATASSLTSISGVRVSPLLEIEYFLRKMDEAIIPKIYLPTPQRDPNFNYFKGKPSGFRDKALAGDPYAAHIYAEHVVKNGVRTLTDKGMYAYEANHTKRELAMAEAREFYVRALRGGITSVADVLSRLYVSPVYGDRIESLAWRKISFVVGESERYNCLRNSTTCVVKDFNNLNRLELFYPCLSSAKGDSCAQSEYEQAMTRAFQYADSLEFAMYNKPQQ